VAAISEASKGEVLQAAERLSPQVVLLDLMMPRVSGEEVARWLRAHPRLGRTPIVVMSALSDAEVRARHLGADGFLAKPFSIEALLAEVERFDDARLEVRGG
jgi:CheY-like chemotaxis protein